jgi:hypothetical protein
MSTTVDLNDYLKLADGQSGSTEDSTARGMFEKGGKDGFVTSIRESLIALMTEYFGPLTKDVQGKLDKASLAQLELYLIRLPTANELREVFEETT